MLFVLIGGCKYNTDHKKPLLYFYSYYSKCGKIKSKDRSFLRIKYDLPIDNYFLQIDYDFVSERVYKKQAVFFKSDSMLYKVEVGDSECGDSLFIRPYFSLTDNSHISFKEGMPCFSFNPETNVFTRIDQGKYVVQFSIDAIDGAGYTIIYDTNMTMQQLLTDEGSCYKKSDSVIINDFQLNEAKAIYDSITTILFIRKEKIVFQ